MFARVFAILAIVVILLPVSVQAQEDSPDVYKTTIFWNKNDVDLLLELMWYTSNGDICSTGYQQSEDCLKYGNPIEEYDTDYIHFSITWKHIPQYGNYSLCINEFIRYGSLDEYDLRVGIVTSKNDKVISVQSTSLNHQFIPKCYGLNDTDRGELDIDFIQEYSRSISPVTTPDPDFRYQFRLIQPEGGSLILQIDSGAETTGVNPNWDYAFNSVSSSEIPEGSQASDALVNAQKERLFLDHFGMIISTAGPNINEIPSKFAVAVYDSGNLVGLYFGQINSSMEMLIFHHPYPGSNIYLDIESFNGEYHILYPLVYYYGIDIQLRLG